jgi:hypothetical protein
MMILVINSNDQVMFRVKVKSHIGDGGPILSRIQPVVGRFPGTKEFRQAGVDELGPKRQ